VFSLHAALTAAFIYLTVRTFVNSDMRCVPCLNLCQRHPHRCIACSAVRWGALVLGLAAANQHTLVLYALPVVAATLSVFHRVLL
jgi:hypothetical protein